MKLLHTADWHAGRNLHGVDRTAEVRAALSEVAELAKVEAVDLVVVAGDVYDNRNPSAAAEEAVYDFFLEVSGAGIPSVVIAGNHDSPQRLDAVGSVLRLANVHVVGAYRPAGAGGAFELDLGGERVRVAALPFLSERRMIAAANLIEWGPGEQHDQYRQVMRKLVDNLTGDMDGSSVNLLLMHTTFEGATLANSEYVFHSTNAYTVPASIVPEAVSYAALGHIHKPQAVQGLAENKARYPGSLLQLDFGEAGDARSVVLAELAAGRPTEYRLHQLAAGKPLKRVVASEEELERRVLELASFDGWLKLVVRLQRPRPGLKERLQQDLPNLLLVEQQLPGEEEDDEAFDLEALSLVDSFREYLRTERGDQGQDELVKLFEKLHDEVTP
ncbi:MAG: exonuclease SbcCD subunit D C-terminal domain-containing protein [Truepera sp.]|jgi:exonuclease SbcD|nr:exonuclease SbcCD subunit D C-terminal domain-containing protein [Truepera sp.]